MNIEIRKIADYRHLYNIIANDVKNQKIVIKINVNFINPIDVLILTKFYIHQKNNKCNIIFIPIDKYQKQYLESIGLINFCETNLIHSIAIEDIDSLTAMPIKRVNQDSMDSYINLITKYLASFCENKNLDMLNILIAELINNVYDHSQSPIDAYAFCQFYPKNNTIKVGVSDLGIGIPKSVNKFLEKENKQALSDQEAIEWAITLNRTTKSHPRNQGKGLDNINSFITENKSSWFLFSGGASMKSNFNWKSFSSNPIKNFIGTVIELNIKIDNLEEIEPDENFGQDDWNWGF